MIRRDPITKMKKWIICETCKTAMKEANRRARGMREALRHEVNTNKIHNIYHAFILQTHHQTNIDLPQMRIRDSDGSPKLSQISSSYHLG